MTGLKSIILLGMSIFITSCSGSVYAPTGQYGGFPHGGYGDTRLSADKYLVYFTGNRYNTIDQVNSYLLYHAAELTIAQGYNYFVVLTTSTSTQNVSVSTKTRFQQVRNYPSTYSDSTQLTGFSSNDPANYLPDPRTVHGGSASIQMFKGEIPLGMPNAYYADQYMAQFGAPPESSL